MSLETIEKLKMAILEYDPTAAALLAKQCVADHTDPLLAIDALTAVIRQVGDAFGRGEIFLPELIGAARAMESAQPVLLEELTSRNMQRKPVGTVVIGTVFGDLHNIGKAMVSTLLTAAGFAVHDLGVNVTAEEFVEAVKAYEPNLLAMSALLTLTAPEQEKVIRALEREGLRRQVSVMVGGAAIDERFAKDVGADGYDPTAGGAVVLARKLIGAE